MLYETAMAYYKLNKKGDLEAARALQTSRQVQKKD